MEVLQTDHLDEETMEAELTALGTATVEAEWLRKLLTDLPVAVSKAVSSACMFKVNSAKDNVKSSRHVKRRLKSIRKMRVISMTYIHTDKKTWQIPLQKGYHRM